MLLKRLAIATVVGLAMVTAASAQQKTIVIEYYRVTIRQVQPAPAQSIEPTADLIIVGMELARQMLLPDIGRRDLKPGAVDVPWTSQELINAEHDVFRMWRWCTLGQQPMFGVPCAPPHRGPTIAAHRFAAVQ